MGPVRWARWCPSSTSTLGYRHRYWGIAAAAMDAGRWWPVFCFRFSPSYVVRIFDSYSELPTHLFIHAVIIDWRSMTVARSNFDRFERHLGGQSNSVRSYRWKHLREFVWNADIRPSPSVRGSVGVHPTQATSCIVQCGSSHTNAGTWYGRYGVRIPDILSEYPKRGEDDGSRTGRRSSCTFATHRSYVIVDFRSRRNE